MSDKAALRTSLRFGWTALALFALLGLGLETLHLVKAPEYMQVRLRRELWILAHAHGVLLALINIVFGMYAAATENAATTLRVAAQALRFGAVAMPVGFLLGGIGNSETDPSLAIVLVPVGAIAVLYALYATARIAYSEP